MKTTTVAIVTLAALAWSTGSGQAQGVVLNFANNPGGYVEFGGASDTFQFANGSDGYQWIITSEQGGSSAIGLPGSVLNGPFTYGPITSTFGGLVQTADVLGPLGQLVINSPSGNLTADVNWVDVTTVFSAVGAFNASVTINVTDMLYAGTNPDLQRLVANQPGTLDLTFQFNPGASLSTLSAGPGGYDTSYSGSIAAGVGPVPEPGTVTLLILGAVGLLGLARRNNSGV